MAALEVLRPVYWLGWVIQPGEGGFWVYDRADHSKDTGVCFPTMGLARMYIMSCLSRG